jgi:hypothetical protein
LLLFLQETNLSNIEVEEILKFWLFLTLNTIDLWYLIH